MVTISIIGSGNVAQHLADAFAGKDAISLEQVFSRNVANIPTSIPKEKIIYNYSELKEVDLYIIAVSDSAIAEVSSKIPFSEKLVVHTSGSQSIGILDDKNRKGVFYPLQTFTKNKPVDFGTIPICIESEFSDDYQLLELVAKSISAHPYAIHSAQRRALHVAAVFVNNFTNHLYKIAADICAESKIPFEILKPLIAETADKIMVLSPSDAQTGPAKRNDINTIQTHLEFLQADNLKNIYKTLTQSIIDDGKKL